MLKKAIKTWRRIGWVISPQSNADFATAMEQVLDIYRCPYDPAFQPAQANALWDRFEFSYTRKLSSWLNVAEAELGVMIRQCLNRRIDSIRVLRVDVTAWQA